MAFRVVPPTAGRRRIKYDRYLSYLSVEMVDEMDEICREHRDPWEAAHVIADRFIEPMEQCP
jgi:hypothetical protein